MMDDMDQWKAQLAKLSTRQRAELAEFLLSSLEPDGDCGVPTV
jgi:hypothetical protein